MERVLILGASSFVGVNLAFALREKYRVLGTYCKHVPRIDGIQTFRFDINQTSEIPEFIKSLEPDAVVYCSAVIDDRECSRDAVQALFVNSQAPYIIAQVMRKLEKRLIYLSTSKVFDGTQGNYTEEDEARPQNLYGSMKLHAEEQLSHFENVFVLRLGTIFGMGSSGQKSVILNRLLWDLWDKKPIKVIADEFRSFTSALEVARAIETTLGARAEKAGLYHLATREKHTYFSFAKEIASLFGIEDAKVNPISGSEFSGEMAKSGGSRGADLTLNGSLFEKTFGVTLQGLTPSLLTIRNAIRTGQM